VFLGKVRIRGKLALLATIPLLAVAALTVPLVLNQVRVANRAAETARSVRIASAIGSIAQELQQERMQAAGYLVRLAGEADLVEQAARVTDKTTDVRAELGDELPAEVSAAVDGIQDLGPVRAQVLARRMAPEQAVAAFSTVIGRLIKSLHLGERLDLTAPGSRQVVALDAVLRMDEGISSSAAYIVIAAATRSPAAIGLLGSTLAAVQSTAERVQTFATAEQVSLYNLVQEAFEARAGKDFITGIAADPIRTIASLSAPTLFPELLSFITLGRFVERKIATEVTAQVTSQQGRALTIAYATAGISVAVLLLVVVLSIVVARAVARPLTRLTRSAERVAVVAEEELERVADDESEAAAPVHLAPVEVGAQDEIGDLARAFERVQHTAARLVERQVASRRNVAQMFGHVGRRTQNLVGRQIALIDQLERGEQDPGRLQYLYRLDHVSSRLRRNAGSLVVLSGEAGAEPHVAPVQLGDVVRLALGEIEDYTRVDISVPDDLVVSPALVGDLVLMLAELMENATNFSPPHTRVSVSATRSGIGTGARLTIVDHGLGLPPERLTEENARLARRERLDLAPTEVLGLFVVGRLARRYGVGVTLSPTPGGGVTAAVELPQHMLVPVTVEPEASTLRLVEPAAVRAPAVQARAALPAAPSVRVVASASLTRTEPPFDVAVLERASRTLAAGPIWNAFATGEHHVPPALSEVDSTEPNPPSTPPEPTPPQPALRRRVRGAQLPLDGSPQPAGSSQPAGPPEPSVPVGEVPSPADPESARTLVEEFEAGVRRALGETPDKSSVDAPVSPAHAPALTRRVPGATLQPAEVPSGQPRADYRPPDPEQVRSLVEQYESGVTRALGEVGSDHRHEEDEPR
jgi:Nitrate and nitrite sensing/Histidine kinase-, DNA gyrase B-, and HSP90-like ATPase/HAMP domain